MYEAFEHTADIGLRIRADSLDELFAEAGRGLMSLAVENPADIRAAETIQLALQADNLPDLFFDWLSELLYLLEARHLLFSRFDIHVEPGGPSLAATIAGEAVDRQRHLVGQEIKAVTYHQLRVEQTPDGWLAEVIFDL